MKSSQKDKGFSMKVFFLTVTAIILTGTLNASAQLVFEDFAGAPLAIICALYDAFVLIASALGGLIIVVSGVIWISAHDDPGKRKTAKSAIIHALVGLIIVSVAIVIIDGIEIRMSDDVTTIDFVTACSYAGLCNEANNGKVQARYSAGTCTTKTCTCSGSDCSFVTVSFPSTQLICEALDTFL